MTTDEFSEKLKKLALFYRNNNVLDDKKLKSLDRYFEIGDESKFYTSTNNSDSEYGNKISHSVYDSEKNFLNDKILDYNNKSFYIKTTNDLYLKSSDNGELFIDKLENLDSSFEWKVNMNTKGYKSNSNSVEIRDYQNKKLKVDIDKKVKCIKQEESSRFTKWKIINYDNFFLLETLKFKDFYLDASNISFLVSDIK